MNNPRDPAAKLRLIFELLELGERAFIHKLKKKSPEISAEDINRELTKWYHERPGAEFGDSPGVLRDSGKVN